MRLFARYNHALPPMGLLYIAAVLEQRGHSVVLIDAFAEKLCAEEVVRRIGEAGPGLVGITCVTPSATEAVAIGQGVREARLAPVVMGNLHAVTFREEFLLRGYADFVVRGEGEEAMSELAARLEQGRNPGDVLGLSYIEGGAIHDTGDREPIVDLDALPFPAWHLAPLAKYRAIPLAEIARKVMLVAAGRDCPYRCQFCAHWKIVRPGFRRRSGKNVADEIEYLIEHFGIEAVVFVDAIFPVNAAQCDEVCGEIIRRRLHKKITWVSETRPDLFTRSLGESMREAGCTRVMFGLECGSEDLLRGVGKSTSVAQAREAVATARAVGFEVVGFFMLGLPGENWESFRRTMDLAKSLDLDLANFPLVVPYPGTLLYGRYEEAGAIRSHDWSEYGAYPSKELPYRHDRLSSASLIEMQKIAHFKFYIRPRMIYRHLFQLKKTPVREVLSGGLSALWEFATRSRAGALESFRPQS